MLLSNSMRIVLILSSPANEVMPDEQTDAEYDISKNAIININRKKN